MKDVYTEVVLKVLCNRAVYVGIKLPSTPGPPSTSTAETSSASIDTCKEDTLISTSSTMIQFSDLPSIRKLISTERMR